MQKVLKFIDHYRYVFIIIVVILAVTGIIILNNDYNNEHYTETWVVCEFKPVYSNYTETIKFKYKGSSTMKAFYRNEVFTESSDNTDEDKSLKSIYEYFEEDASELNNNDNFKYDVTKTDTEVDVDTYINVETYKDNFDEYVEDLYVNSDMTAKQVKSALESTNYTCEISRK